MYFFSQNFINIFLEDNWRIKKTKKHDLVLKIAISDMKNSLLFIILKNLYLIIGISKI